LTRSFNLLDEPWIPCLPRGSGQATNKSLLDLVKSASELSAIHHPSPIVTLVLYRFTIGFLCAALRGPKSVKSLQTILDAGSFDMEQVGACAQKWRDRFWLFDNERPFLQDPTLATDGKPSPVFKLARETALASEQGKVHFDHTLEGSMSPAEAACYVLADQFFALQDGRGYSPSPLTFGAAVLVEGENLFETLALNLLVYNEERPIKSNLAADKPYWEQDSRDLSAFPAGWLDYVTRPYRRLLLVRSSRQDVTGVFRKSGVGLDKQWRAAMMDPWVAYSVSASGNVPVKLEKDRALWRDAHSLIQSLAEREKGAPGYKNILAMLNHKASLSVFGVDAGNNDVALWRHERRLSHRRTSVTTSCSRSSRRP
jgi:CRISPR system Cascade subunit CasA